ENRDYPRKIIYKHQEQYLKDGGRWAGSVVCLLDVEIVEDAVPTQNPAAPEVDVTPEDSPSESDAAGDPEDNSGKIEESPTSFEPDQAPSNDDETWVDAILRSIKSWVNWFLSLWK